MIFSLCRPGGEGEGKKKGKEKGLAEREGKEKEGEQARDCHRLGVDYPLCRTITICQFGHRHRRGKEGGFLGGSKGKGKAVSVWPQLDLTKHTVLSTLVGSPSRKGSRRRGGKRKKERATRVKKKKREGKINNTTRRRTYIYL